MVQADEGASERDEGEMDVLAFFVAHREAAEAGHLGVCAFHNPSVTAQVTAAVHAAARDAGQEATPAALVAAAAAIIRLVGMELPRAAAWAAPLA